MGLLVAILPGPALAACGLDDMHRSEFEHRLALAEEHRGWVEFWIDLDDLEARAELRYFAAELRRAVEAMPVSANGDDRRLDLRRSRIGVERTWYERKHRQLGD